MAQPPASDTLPVLIRRLAADVAALLALYGATLREHLRRLAADLGMAALLIGAALVLGVFALGLAVATLVLVVAIWLPGWLAALVVLLTVVLLMALLVLAGLGRVRRRRARFATLVAEEVRWLRSLFPSEN